MAARLNPALMGTPQIVDLRSVGAPELEPVLQEETAAWRTELDWDFDKSADLVRRFVDLRALNGAALVEHGEVTGYLYYVLEEGKGLVGDLYVRHAVRTRDRENLLLESAMDAITRNTHVHRVESQLMMLSYNPRRVLPRADVAAVFDRNFMRVSLPDASLTEGRVRRPMYIERWSDLYQDDAAQLIAYAYAGHVDSRINDQYRNAMGARRFLHNIVEYPGCGTFFRTASYAAFEAVHGTDLRHLAGQSGIAGLRAYYPDLRFPAGARYGHWPRAAAAFPVDTARGGLPVGQSHGNQLQ